MSGGKDEVTELVVTIPGDPQAWQRAGRGRGRGHHYTQHETRAFERRVRQLAWLEARRAQLEGVIVGPVLLHVRSFFGSTDVTNAKRPETLMYCRPDVDNLVKSVADGLNPEKRRTNGILGDDGQVAVLVAEKWRAAGNEEGRTEIRLASVETEAFKHTCPLCGAAKGALSS